MPTQIFDAAAEALQTSEYELIGVSAPDNEDAPLGTLNLAKSTVRGTFSMTTDNSLAVSK